MADNLVDFAIDPTSGLARRHHIDVDDALQLIMVDFGRRIHRRYIGHGLQRRVILDIRSTQRDFFEILHAHVLDLLIEVLYSEHVVVPRLGIDPVARFDHAVGSQRGDYVVHHLFGRESNQTSAFAIDAQLQSGIKKILGNQHATHALAASDLFGDVRRHFISAVDIVASHLYIDGSRQSQVDYRIDQPARLKVSIEFRQIFRQFASNPAHVFVAAEFVVFFQANLHKSCIHGRVAGVHGGEVRRDPDVGDDHSQIMRFDHLMNIFLDAGDVLIRDLKPGTAWRFHVDDELAWIRARKVGRPHKWKNSRNDQDDTNGNPAHGSSRPRQSASHPTLIEIQELLKALVELAKEPCEKRAWP